MKRLVEKKERITDEFVARLDSGERVVLYDWGNGDITYFIKDGDYYVLVSAQNGDPHLKEYMDEDEARFRLIAKVPNQYVL